MWLFLQEALIAVQFAPTSFTEACEAESATKLTAKVSDLNLRECIEFLEFTLLGQNASVELQHRHRRQRLQEAVFARAMCWLRNLWINHFPNSNSRIFFVVPGL